MRNRRHISVLCVGLGIVVLAVLALVLATAPPVNVQADDRTNPPPFDFSDQFYRANGINPDAIGERAGSFLRNPAHWVVDNSNTDPDRRNFRILETTGGFNNSGSLIYYSIMGTVVPSTFTNDDAGARAQEIANSFRAFLFPKTLRNPDCSPGNVILSPAPPNRRQDNIFDTRNGYFSNNPLGLWILAFVVYTQKAFTPTPFGCQLTPKLAEIAAKNGTDLDGTPILTTADGIDGLVKDGLVEIRTRPLDGSRGFPWVI